MFLYGSFQDPFRIIVLWCINMATRIGVRNLSGLIIFCWKINCSRRNLPANGWMGVVLKSKLKELKEEIRVWSKQVYGDIDFKVARLVEDIVDLDVKGEFGVLSSGEVELRKLKFDEMWKLLKCKEASVFQRSKSKWLKEGDENSKYFHQWVKARVAKNSLKAIKVDGVWVDKPEDVRREVVAYFRRQLEVDRRERPTLDGVDFARLSVEENRDLIATFSSVEIEAVVKASDGKKSLGPNGFNFASLKSFGIF